MNIGVIFDMDGVLVLTEEAHWKSWQNVARSRGIELRYEVFLSCFGRVNADCVAIMLGADIPHDEALRLADQKEAEFRDLVRAAVPLAPGTRELLESLHAAGDRVGVGSSAPPENVDLVLDAGDIRRYFTSIVNGSQVKRGKPAPDVFLQAGAGLSLPPERCLVVEDAPVGIRAARAAGMIAVGVTTTHTEQQLRDAGAHALFPSVASLTREGLRRLVGGEQHSL